MWRPEGYAFYRKMIFVLLDGDFSEHRKQTSMAGIFLTLRFQGLGELVRLVCMPKFQNLRHVFACWSEFGHAHPMSEKENILCRSNILFW